MFLQHPEYFISVVDTFLNKTGRYFIKRNFSLPKIQINESVAMRTIHFENNEYLFEPNSLPDLIIMGNYLKEHPEIKFEIGGHTDSYGKYEYNKWLSEKRAESVADFFIGLGVQEQNITSKGYGESMLLLPDTSQDNRYINRRVEIKLMGIN